MSGFESRHAHSHHMGMVAEQAIREAMSAIDRDGPFSGWRDVYTVLSEGFLDLDVFAKVHVDPESLYSEAIRSAGIALRAAVIAKRQMLDLQRSSPRYKGVIALTGNLVVEGGDWFTDADELETRWCPEAAIVEVKIRHSAQHCVLAASNGGRMVVDFGFDPPGTMLERCSVLPAKRIEFSPDVRKAISDIAIKVGGTDDDGDGDL